MTETAKAPAAKDPPDDNNKRLAYLEETAPKVLAVVASLVGLLLPDHELAPKDPDEGPLAHTIRLVSEASDALEGRRDELEERIKGLEEDLAAAKKSNAAAERAARSKHGKGAKQVKARKVGELKGGTDRAALDAAMAAEAEFEIVFSTGTSEIIEFDPVIVYPPAFTRLGRERYNLRDAIMVRGAGREHRVRGVGLLVDGKQIAYTEFPKAVAVPVGQEMKFDRMIGF